MQINWGGCRCGCEHLRLPCLPFFWGGFFSWSFGCSTQLSNLLRVRNDPYPVSDLFCGTPAVVSDAVATVRTLPFQCRTAFFLVLLFGRITNAAAAIRVLGIFQRWVRRCCSCCAYPWCASYSDKILENGASVFTNQLSRLQQEGGEN